MRRLDDLDIAYTVATYDVDEDDLSAQTVADKVNMPLERTWKTLCLEGDKHGHCFALLPGDCELDLKKLARASGDRKVHPVAVKELRALTGYIRGGVTALAAKKMFPVFVDELVQLHETISVSAGQRGIQLFMAPADYIKATDAKLADLIRLR